MKIGVVSDTHVPGRAKKLPGVVFDLFKGAGHIFRAGDLTSMEVIEELEKIAP